MPVRAYIKVTPAVRHAQGITTSLQTGRLSKCSLNLLLKKLYNELMNVRNARVSDVRAINALISSYAERDRMLFRSMADIYENLQTFIVAELDGEVVGCCGLEVIWSDLAEIKSLAVDGTKKAMGIGKMMVNAAIEQAAVLGVPRVFALTLEPEFFRKLNFEIVEKEALPMKVWSDCARCPKQQHCDEVAVIKDVNSIL